MPRPMLSNGACYIRAMMACHAQCRLTVYGPRDMRACNLSVIQLRVQSKGEDGMHAQHCLIVFAV